MEHEDLRLISPCAQPASDKREDYDQWEGRTTINGKVVGRKVC